MRFPFNRRVLLASAIAAASQAGFVNAAGFSINEQSASSMGTAFAGRASNAEDASIAASNPAGIAFLDRTQVTLGSAVILEGGKFEGNYDGEGNRESSDFLKNTPVPFGHFVMPINDKFSYGLSAYAPFGINIDYDDDSAARYFGDKTYIETINLQNTFSYKVQDNLSLGLGLTASHISGELTQSSRLTHPLLGEVNDINSDVKGDDWAFTWNLGVVWKPTEATTLGASYHAKTDFKLTGDAQATSASRPAINFKHDVELEVTMPEKVMFSVTHELNKKWTVLADATWTRWSELDSISIVDKQGTSANQYVEMKWRNVWALSVGTAYKLNQDWTLKAGYMFDQSPTTNSNRTVRAPDGDRNWFTAGAKWDATDAMTFDFSAAYVMLKDGKINESKHEADGSVDDTYGNLTGEYKDQSSWILAAQMTYRF